MPLPLADTGKRYRRHVTYHFTTAIWQVESMATWVFVSLPDDVTEQIKAMPWPPAPGFGSLRVAVRIDATEWRTSIFPSKEGPFVLPVKKAVRDAVGATIGDDVEVHLDLVDAP